MPALKQLHQVVVGTILGLRIRNDRRRDGRLALRLPMQMRVDGVCESHPVTERHANTPSHRVHFDLDGCARCEEIAQVGRRLVQPCELEQHGHLTLAHELPRPSEGGPSGCLWSCETNGWRRRGRFGPQPLGPSRRHGFHFRRRKGKTTPHSGSLVANQEFSIRCGTDGVQTTTAQCHVAGMQISQEWTGLADAPAVLQCPQGTPAIGVIDELKKAVAHSNRHDELAHSLPFRDGRIERRRAAARQPRRKQHHHGARHGQGEDTAACVGCQTVGQGQAGHGERRAERAPYGALQLDTKSHREPCPLKCLGDARHGQALQEGQSHTVAAQSRRGPRRQPSLC
eukprot:scaffold12646_cov115-Isochrysis_galbana.AAC.3